MAIKNRADLKAFFETGDKPTQEQFADLIDSCFNLINNADSITHFKKLLIPSADVLLLNNNPKDFIASPGLNKFIQIIVSSVFVDFNTIAYDTHIGIYFTTDTAIYDQSYSSTILSTNSSLIYILHPIWPATVSDTQLIPDKKVVIFNKYGNPLNGNSDITCYAAYKIIDI